MEVPEEFLEILDGDFVDKDRICRVSSFGIPDSIREDIYRLLLGIQKGLIIGINSLVIDPESAQEYYSQARKGKNHDMIKRIRGEIGRLYSSRPNLFHLETVNMLENIASAYFYAHSDKEYSPSLIYICCPLVLIFKKESDIYHAFEKMMGLYDEYIAVSSISERISNFMMLFKAIMPDLFKHFEEEEIDVKDFSKSWFSCLLAKELPVDCVLRLWDVYLTHPLGFELHVYSCLAILLCFKDVLEDLDESDIRGAVLKIPPLDMDQILSEAGRLRIEIAGADDLDMIESRSRKSFF